MSSLTKLFPAPLFAAIGLAVVLTSSASAQSPSPDNLVSWSFDQDQDGWQAAGDCELTVADGVL